MRKLLLLLLLLPSSPPLPSAAEFTVIATTDIHARLDAWRRLAPQIEAERLAAGPERTLLADIGDTVQGTIEGLFRHGELPLAMLNFLRYDFWAPGNHDFEIRPFRFRDFSGVVLGANWQTPDFTPIPWKLLELDGVRVAVIGLTENQIPYRLLPGDPVKVTPQLEALDRFMPEIRRARPDFIILLRHDGLYGRGLKLHDLIARYPEIDLVVGGHTHVEVPGERVGRAFYVQSGKHGEAFAVIKVEFHPGQPARITSRLIRPAAEAELPPLPPELERNLLAARNWSGEEIGRIPGEWHEPDLPLFTGTALGQAVAAAMRRHTGAGVVVATRNTGRSSYAGTLTRRQLFELFPFENRIVRIELSPEELRQFIETEAALLRRGHRSAVFAGVDLTLDRRFRITRLILPEPDANGRISVAVSDYAAAGAGDLSPALRRAIEAGAPWRDTGILIREAVAEELPPVAP